MSLWLNLKLLAVRLRFERERGTEGRVSCCFSREHFGSLFPLRNMRGISANELLTVLYRSLITYLGLCLPWARVPVCDSDAGRFAPRWCVQMDFPPWSLTWVLCGIFPGVFWFGSMRWGYGGNIKFLIRAAGHIQHLVGHSSSWASGFWLFQGGRTIVRFVSVCFHIPRLGSHPHLKACPWPYP